MSFIKPKRLLDKEFQPLKKVEDKINIIRPKAERMLNNLKMSLCYATILSSTQNLPEN